MASAFRCSIVTPTAIAYEGEVTYVTFQAWDGQQGIMAGEAPLLAKMGIGPARIDTADGHTLWFLLGGGFAQMQNDELTLLTDEATAADQIDLAEAEDALRQANEQAVTGIDDRDAREQQQQRAMAQVTLARAAGK